jgi:hypothetical protein
MKMPEHLSTRAAAGSETSAGALLKTHLLWGWGFLLFFLLLGVALEGLHAFKAPEYLAASQKTRRLLWTLGHAHGSGLGLIHLAFAGTVGWLLRHKGPLPTKASIWMKIGSLFVPAGFIGAGFFARNEDPGYAILLVPVGALLIAGSALSLIFAIRACPASERSDEQEATTAGRVVQHRGE